MNLDVFILATCICILLDQPHPNVIAKKITGKQYDMGCECGKRKVDAHSEEDCELSAKLEESGPIDHDKYHRIVGGCNAGHTPWYTLFILTGQDRSRHPCMISFKYSIHTKDNSIR